jgi:hypothetical protein
MMEDMVSAWERVRSFQRVGGMLDSAAGGGSMSNLSSSGSPRLRAPDVAASRASRSQRSETWGPCSTATAATSHPFCHPVAKPAPTPQTPASHPAQRLSTALLTLFCTPSLACHIRPHPHPHPHPAIDVMQLVETATATATLRP